MKALTIKVIHGRVWIAETHTGVRYQAASLTSLLDHLAAPGYPTYEADQLLQEFFDRMPDSGGGGQIGTGQASA